MIYELWPFRLSISLTDSCRSASDRTSVSESFWTLGFVHVFLAAIVILSEGMAFSLERLGRRNQWIAFEKLDGSIEAKEILSLAPAGDRAPPARAKFGPASSRRITVIE